MIVEFAIICYLLLPSLNVEFEKWIPTQRDILITNILLKSYRYRNNVQENGASRQISSLTLKFLVYMIVFINVWLSRLALFDELTQSILDIGLKFDCHKIAITLQGSQEVKFLNWHWNASKINLISEFAGSLNVEIFS